MISPMTTVRSSNVVTVERDVMLPSCLAPSKPEVSGVKLTIEEVDDDDDDGDGDDDDETGGALKARATKHLISVRALGPPSAPLDSYF